MHDSISCISWEVFDCLHRSPYVSLASVPFRKSRARETTHCSQLKLNMYSSFSSVGLLSLLLVLSASSQSKSSTWLLASEPH